MPPTTIHPLANMVETLAVRTEIDEEDRAAILGLPYSVRSFDAGSYIIRDGDESNYCRIILDGFAVRHKLNDEGLRQIVSVHIRDDILDSERLYLKTADHNVQTLTRCDIALIPGQALRDLFVNRPSVSVAMFTDTLVEASRYREWMLNIGRRDARTRLAHFLCEIAVRLGARGLAPGHRYELPMTQEQLGDALGLTSVHVNRTLKSLESDGLIVRHKRILTFPDWSRLKIADFNDRYLHLVNLDLLSAGTFATG